MQTVANCLSLGGKRTLGDAALVAAPAVFTLDDVQRLELEPPVAERQHDGGGPVCGVQLAHDIGEVILYGALGDSQPAADGPVTPADGDVRQNLQFAAGEGAAA